ncbi:hypothetical protein BDN72DRAFT_337894 [Pluteus cervinus]|uniref:Uncharacterized protein n=1 Tax=Pluteus cervinus TaxID=181527 RepID=A0ACD3ACD3_9AGAR|nr:hypothetical protein BDN72DRAFT_337894 [Pluteus cervinus]
MSSSSTARERQQIDQEIIALTDQIVRLHNHGPPDVVISDINTLKERIRLLRSKRNSLAPVSSLPPEVVITIFTFTCSYADRTALIKSQTRPPAALVISSVSRYWRALALGCPALWTTITFLNGDLVYEYASRAPGQVLTVHTSGLRTSAVSNKIAGLLFVVLSRARDLYISGDTTLGSYHHFNVFPAREWESPAPMLTHLFLENVNLPDNTFNGTCPALQSLSLLSCRLNWQKILDCVPVGIKTLHIAQPEPSGYPDAAHLLAQFQELEDLTLHSVFSPHHNQLQIDPNTHRRVQLPKLRRLSLRKNRWTATLDFLQRITLPNDIGVLDIGCWFRPFDGYVPISGILNSSCDISQWIVRSLVVRRSESVVGCVVEGTPGLGGSATLEQEFISSQGLRPPPSFDTFFNSLAPLGINHIESLVFDGKFNSPEEDPIHIPFQFFGKVTTLISLTIGASYLDPFMRFLGDEFLRLSSSTPQDTSVTPPPPEVLFSKLHSLTIEGDFHGTSIDRLVAWVRVRGQLGRSIERLRLRPTFPRPAILERLREHVEDVYLIQ